VPISACGGKLRVIACIEDPPLIRKILEHIQRFIGRRPILAVGNSDGDYQMLEWTTAGEGRRLGLIVHHTDATREWAYDRESSTRRLDRGLDDAATHGWRLIDMASEWNRVFPAENRNDPRKPEKWWALKDLNLRPIDYESMLVEAILSQQIRRNKTPLVSFTFLSEPNHLCFSGLGHGAQETFVIVDKHPSSTGRLRLTGFSINGRPLIDSFGRANCLASHRLYIHVIVLH